VVRVAVVVHPERGRTGNGSDGHAVIHFRAGAGPSNQD
jgi:hypothetical protein